MPVAITIGDPSGIGPEIIVKSLRKLSPKLREKIILIGDKKIFLKAGWNENLSSILEIYVPDFKLIKSKPNSFSGKLSFKAFELGVRLLKNRKISALITAPISKKSWDLAQIKYIGHTDYLRDFLKEDFLMAFKKGNINAGLLTEHIPLKNVSDYVNVENIFLKMKLLIKMSGKFNKAKKFIIAGLNPHCGDGGVIGNEEIKHIIPAIKKLSKKELKIFGPYSADNAIRKYIEFRADGALFMYHDQLISTLKLIDNKNNIVHISFNEKFIRTSPTHGTAFDIAWKNIADESSMLNSVKLTFELLK